MYVSWRCCYCCMAGCETRSWGTREGRGCNRMRESSARAERGTMVSEGKAARRPAKFLSAAGWSILLHASTMGKRTRTKWAMMRCRCCGATAASCVPPCVSKSQDESPREASSCARAAYSRAESRGTEGKVAATEGRRERSKVDPHFICTCARRVRVRVHARRRQERLTSKTCLRARRCPRHAGAYTSRIKEARARADLLELDACSHEGLG